MWNIFKRRKTATADEALTANSATSIRVTPWLKLRKVRVVGENGTFYGIQVMNTALKRPHWDMISPRLDNEDASSQYLETVLHPHNDLGKRTVALLESMLRNSRDNGVECMFYYLRHMVEYFERCFVADRETIEMQFVTQCDDMGDEICDTVWGVNRELFGGRSLGDSFSMRVCGLDMEFVPGWPGVGKSVRINADGREEGVYNNIGSNYKTPLRAYVKFNLRDIDLCKMPDVGYKS